MSTPPLPPPPPAVPPRGPGLSRTARFWIGVAVGVFGAPALTIGVVVLLSTLTSGSGSAGDTALQALVVLVPVALVVTGLVVRATRWVVLGALAGGSVVLIVLAGACAAILKGLGAY
ncbi:hypothetical protein [Phycicoccus sonneratiae]|uniref:Uncharacterized protein n=1 Tax=Phycicoccus sonneratiae TaxID=2807628 RepID=A0ABS2CIB6_9MICO|nr:hypothetical protein [Phycicoccus sonneraticus]MBM6399617.1 hypothetical protein [Phycicoccus sonneraticus]